MNCREAQELFGLLRDLPEQHPQRLMLERHLLGCESCAGEYQQWEESLDMLQYIPLEVTEEQAEAVNRRVDGSDLCRIAMAGSRRQARRHPPFPAESRILGR
ncbi:hypothetical protein HMSSN139_26310 [Paenibacillus sp. HMSSN-139]|nr:hypothetical protein HMSSN139_26310 [Paenibacillus sp. HMSSN-139]